jgi:Arc/MetJ-type ribon-helix-helix transcriptional regulator
MSYPFPPDVQQLVNERMARGGYATEDDVLRDAFAALTWEEQELEAVLQAVDALENGDEGIPLEVAFEQLQRKHGIRADG